MVTMSFNKKIYSNQVECSHVALIVRKMSNFRLCSHYGRETHRHHLQQWNQGRSEI